MTTRKTYSIIIWGTGIDYDSYFNQLNYFELLGDIKIVGITSKEDIKFEKIDGYPFIPFSVLHKYTFDLIVIASVSKFIDIADSVSSLGFSKNILIPIKIFSLPHFNLTTYLQIKNSNLTIFANTCWGGFVYNRLGLECLTPFKNAWETPADYLKFLNDPQKYIRAPLTLYSIGYDHALKREYPIGRLLDINIHFNHYTNFDEVKEKWNIRCKRINWDNLFVMMTTERPEEANAFTMLPYDKKVCFVPFDSTQSGILTLPFYQDNNMPFRNIVNRFVTGKYKSFDLLKLLNGELNEYRVN